MRKSTKPAGSTWKNILMASWDLFEQYGYDKTTYQMIADELGITKASISYYFKSKPWILFCHFENYCNAIREYIIANLTENFNYYLYFCILTIRLFTEIMSSENNLRLFNHPEFVDLHTVEWIRRFEEDFRNITEDFHKDFSSEEIHIAALISTGARMMILKEFSDSSRYSKASCYTVDQCCHYLAYTSGALSRLDEATITKNIIRARSFMKNHNFNNITLGKCIT